MTNPGRIARRSLVLVVWPIVAAAALSSLAAEAARPLRRRTLPRKRRWPANAAVGVGAAIVVGSIGVPALARTTTTFARRGLLGRLGLPGPIRALAAFAVLDYTMYWWHRANHRVPVLWRFHAAHHVDPDVDTTTAFRFHPGEVLMSIPLRCATAALAGVLPGEALAYECTMQATAAMHHANVRLPQRLERALALVFITPALHGTHHSRRAEDLRSNWGVVLSIWDRLHRTRRAHVPQEAIEVGIPEQPDDRVAADGLRVLALPFEESSPPA